VVIAPSCGGTPEHETRAHWLSMRYGISQWKGLRWIAAAHALEGLPGISQAFASGRLSIDKVVEVLPARR
jgi:hypothetical protein